jgi:hypothetical protein
VKAFSVALLGCLTELVLASGLQAQYVGVSIGRTISTVDWQYPASSGGNGIVVDAAPNQSRRALAPAIAVQWSAAQWFGIASELRYTKKGYARTEPTLHVDYVEVPVLLRIGRLIDQRSPVTLFAEAGPAFAIRAHCAMLYNGTHGSCENGVIPPSDWRVGLTDVSGILGMGGALRIRSRVVVIGARADWGLRDIGGGFGVPTKNRSSLLYAALLWDMHRAR